LDEELFMGWKMKEKRSIRDGKGNILGARQTRNTGREG
jgi:hypothetical protein